MSSSVAIPIFVILSGWPESGKSTIAKALEAERGVKRVSFGAPVKTDVGLNNPYVRDMIEIHGPEGAKALPNVRRAYQDRGEEIAQIYGEDTLANHMYGRAVSLLGKGLSLVADDARRAPELELGKWIAEEGIRALPITIRVNRYNEDGTPYKSPDHPLEHLLDEVQHDAIVAHREGGIAQAIREVLRYIDIKRAQLKILQNACTCHKCRASSILDLLDQDPARFLDLLRGNR